MLDPSWLPFRRRALRVFRATPGSSGCLVNTLLKWPQNHRVGGCFGHPSQRTAGHASRSSLADAQRVGGPGRSRTPIAERYASGRPGLGDPRRPKGPKPRNGWPKTVKLAILGVANPLCGPRVKKYRFSSLAQLTAKSSAPYRTVRARCTRRVGRLEPTLLVLRYQSAHLSAWVRETQSARRETINSHQHFGHPVLSQLVGVPTAHRLGSATRASRVPRMAIPGYPAFWPCWTARLCTQPCTCEYRTSSRHWNARVASPGMLESAPPAGGPVRAKSTRWRYGGAGP